MGQSLLPSETDTLAHTLTRTRTHTYAHTHMHTHLVQKVTWSALARRRVLEHPQAAVWRAPKQIGPRVKQGRSHLRLCVVDANAVAVAVAVLQWQCCSGSVATDVK